MSTLYVVQSIPVRDQGGAVVGWARVDTTAKGPDPRNTIYLRDGSASPEAEALQRIGVDPTLLYPTREEAVLDGIARLREADGQGGPVRPAVSRD
jgi:hypothetical protein